MSRDSCREFPKVLNSTEQVPSEMRAALGGDLPHDGQIICIYLIPQQRGFWEWFRDEAPRNDMFILTHQEIRVLHESRGGIFKVTRFRIDDIITFEVGTVLLRSWIKFTLAQGRPHSTEEIVLEFGTVFQREFRKSILWLRHLLCRSTQSAEHTWHMYGEEHLQSLPLKFNNAARYYWLLGERALASCSILPTGQRPRLRRWLQTTDIRSTAIVVSNEQMCVINEPDGGGVGHWGQVWHFYPFNRIASCEIQRMAKGDLWALHIGLRQTTSGRDRSASVSSPNQAGAKISFTPSQLSEVERILEVMESCQRRTEGAQARASC